MASYKEQLDKKDFNSIKVRLEPLSLAITNIDF